MKRFVRILAMTLSCAFVLALIVSCAGKDPVEPEDTTLTDTDEVETRKVYGNYDSELPGDLDFGNTEVSLISRDLEGVSDEFFAESTSTGLVPEAVYRRLSAVQEDLNVSISITMEPDNGTYGYDTIAKKVYNDVAGGNCTYEIVTAPNYTITPNTMDGTYQDLNRLPHLNLDKYYWAQEFNEYASVCEKQYAATGMATLTLYRFMYVTVYNDQLFKDFQEKSLYDVVKDDEWTMEYHYALANRIYIDDGNQTKDTADTFGFVSGSRTSVDAFWISNRAWVIGKDDNNNYLYTGNQERLSGMVDKILKLYYQATGSYIVEYGKDNVDNAEISKMFASGNAATANMKIYAIESKLRPVQGLEYSIVPLPKYDETQEKYYTNVQDQVTTLSVPSTLAEEKRETIGAVLEALAAYGYREMYTSYFESALSYRYMQNPESTEMLRVIYEGASFVMVYQSFATNVAWTSMIREMIRDQENGVAGKLGSVEDTIPENIRKINEAFQKLT